MFPVLFFKTDVEGGQLRRTLDSLRVLGIIRTFRYDKDRQGQRKVGKRQPTGSQGQRLRPLAGEILPKFPLELCG